MNTLVDHQSNTLNIESAIVFKQSKSKLEHLHYNPALQLVLENGEYGEGGFIFRTDGYFALQIRNQFLLRFAIKGYVKN